NFSPRSPPASGLGRSIPYRFASGRSRRQDCSHRLGLRLPWLPRPAAAKARRDQEVRVHLPEQARVGVCEGQGPDHQSGDVERVPEVPVASPQCAAAGLDQLLPARGTQGDLRLPERLCLAPGDVLAREKVQPAQLEVDSRSFPARGLADAWQRGAAQAERGRGSSLSLPEESHPLALDGDTDGDDLLNHVDFIARQIGLLDKEIAKRMRPFEAAIEMLDAVYGIGRRTAEDILAEIGVDMSR